MSQKSVLLLDTKQKKKDKIQWLFYKPNSIKPKNKHTKIQQTNSINVLKDQELDP